jgi:acyl carrier protein
MQDELTRRVIAIMAATQHLPEEKFELEKSFQDLGIDSLDAINILFAVENEFDINVPDEAAKEIKTVRDVVEGVRKLVDMKQAEAGSTASA